MQHHEHDYRTRYCFHLYALHTLMVIAVSNVFTVLLPQNFTKWKREICTLNSSGFFTKICVYINCVYINGVQLVTGLYFLCITISSNCN